MADDPRPSRGVESRPDRRALGADAVEGGVPGQPRRGVDASRARELFGWTAQTELRDGMTTTIDWFLNNREAAEARAN